MYLATINFYLQLLEILFIIFKKPFDDFLWKIFNSHPFFARPIICRLNLSVSASPPKCLDEKLLIKL